MLLSSAPRQSARLTHHQRFLRFAITLQAQGLALIGRELACLEPVEKHPHQNAQIAGAEPGLVLQADGVQVGFVAREEGGDVGGLTCLLYGRYDTGRPNSEGMAKVLRWHAYQGGIAAE
ncbi:hypothetical protein [Pseudomonas alliivorans]|uniref:hypothetical protein n=1 Tax=Pseudomonas alliivorans TaxID=2810613 RepID=UPI001AE1A362|nr:hypothetical protein [Pseudomonas alliivorans]